MLLPVKEKFLLCLCCLVSTLGAILINWPNPQWPNWGFALVKTWSECLYWQREEVEMSIRRRMCWCVLSDYGTIAYLCPKRRPLLLKNYFQGINARLEIQTCSSIWAGVTFQITQCLVRPESMCAFIDSSAVTEVRTMLTSFPTW